MSAATVASIAGGATLSQKADALEDAMSLELDKQIAMPMLATNELSPIPSTADNRPWHLKCDSHLPEMPAKPTLIDFFKLRFAPANHVLQSARLAKNNGMEDKVVLACLLHDIAVGNLIRTDHGDRPLRGPRGKLGH